MSMPATLRKRFPGAARQPITVSPSLKKLDHAAVERPARRQQLVASAVQS